MPLKRTPISRYHAIFDPAEEGGFNVSFPNFPGCYTFGRTFEEAKEMAQEVLELWMEVMAEEGKWFQFPFMAAISPFRSEHF